MSTVTAFGAPNTLRLAKRFFWKECRRLGILTEGVFLLMLGFMTAVWWFTPRGVDLGDTLAIIAIGGGAMLAVASAVTLFSVEKEEGTAGLLEQLPRNVVAMTLGKLAAATELVTLNTLMYLLFAGVLSSATTSMWEIIPQYLPQASLFLLEAFVWSLVASLTCPNPLVAAVLGIALASVSVQLGIYITTPSTSGVAALNETGPARLALVGIGLLLAGWLVTRWPAPPRKSHAAGVASLDQPHRRRLGVPWSRLGLFGRLLWQTLRQSWATGIAAILLGLFLTFMSALIPRGFFEINPNWRLASGFGLLFAPAMIGAVIFRADQRRDAYRFLAEHAGRPRMLWLVRNTVGVVSLAVFSLLVTAVVVGIWWLNIRDDSWMLLGWLDDSWNLQVLRITQRLTIAWQFIFVVAAAVLSAYAWGQFFSLALRSDVIAGLMALVASVVICGWVTVVIAWRLQPLTFVLPLAIGALLASLLRVRDWMFDRRGVWRWAAPITVLAAPVAWLAWATPAERLAQVAATPPTIQTADDVFTTFDELVRQAKEERRLGKEVAESYLTLEGKEVTYDEVDGEFDRYDFPVTINKPVHERLDGEALEEFLRLSRIKCRLALTRFETRSEGSGLQEIALMDSPDAKKPIGLDGRLERLLACRRVAAQQANLGLLMDLPNYSYLADEFVAWATAEGQTSARIEKAIEGLRESETMLISPIGRLTNEYHQAKAALAGENGSPLSLGRKERPRPEEWLALLSHEAFAFERERALKALDLLTAYEAAYLGEGMQALTSSKPDLNWLDVYQVDDARLVASLSYTLPNRMVSYPSDLQTLAAVRTSYLVPKASSGQSELTQALRHWIAGVAWRRAERVRLALIAYRIDHNEYPENLEALIGTLLESDEILNPYSNQHFGWSREGFDLPLAKDSDHLFPATAEPGTPLLWGGWVVEPIADLAERQEDGELIAHQTFGGYFVGGEPLGGYGYGEEPEPKPEVHDETIVSAMFLRGSDAFWLPLPK